MPMIYLLQDGCKVEVTDANGGEISDYSNLGTEGHYAELEKSGSGQMKILLHPFSNQDSSQRKAYMCEKETGWSCPYGFIMFQEVCYSFFPEEVRKTLLFFPLKSVISTVMD